MGRKYSDASPEERDVYITNINRRWLELHSLSKEFVDLAIKYMFLVNSGGAVASLGFLGATSDKSEIASLIIIPLCLFVLGIILVGVFSAMRVHDAEKIFSGYRKDVKAFYENEIDSQKIWQNDEARQEISDLKYYIIGYAAFLCFIFGSLVGGISFFCSLN